MKKQLSEVKQTSIERMLQLDGVVMTLEPIGKPRLVMFNGYRPKKEELVKHISRMAPKNAKGYIYGNAKSCTCPGLNSYRVYTGVPVQFYRAP